jgi:hypothetical protein
MLVARIQRTHQVFSEVFPQKLEDCIANFQHDMHPENEVIIWESYARAYTEFLSSRPNTSLAYRKEVFRSVLFMGMGSDDKVEIENFLRDLQHLTVEEAQDLFHMVKESWDSIKIETNYDEKKAAAELDYAALALGLIK